MQAVPPSPTRSTNPWLIFTLICVPILIGSIDLTSIVVILPQATLDLLGPKGLNRAGLALWAVTAYLLAYTISLALVGRLSDVLSRKRIFIVCIILFIVGAVWCGFATGLPLQLVSLLPLGVERDLLPLVSLVLGRIVQAIGAGASVSVGMALVSDVFPPDKRAEPIALIGAIDSVGWVIGNLFAGVMLQVLPSWRGLFLINAAVAFVALIFTLWALRDVKSTATVGAHYDWRGAALFAAMLIALTIGIELLNEPTTTTYLLLGSSGLLLVAFLVLQFRSKTKALFDMTLLSKPSVRTALLVNLLVGFALILVVAGVPLVINLRTLFLRGESLLTGALRAGIVLCALTIPLMVAVLVGEHRYRRVGVAIPVAVGLILAALGFWATQLWTYTDPGYAIALPLALIGTGLGLTIGPLSLIVVDAAEASARGLASSIVLTMRLLGMTLGTPVAASLTLNWANQLADQQIAPLSETYRNVARIMLVPPMATQALTTVMLIGMVACLIGGVVMYAPQALRTIRAKRLGLGAIFSGFPTLIAGIAVVGVLSVIDSVNTPTLLSNPIARILPPNVELYAGFNLQQMFLRETKQPLDSLESLVRWSVAAPASADAAAPAQPAIQPSTESPAVADPSATPSVPSDNASPQVPPVAPDAPPAVPESTTDQVVKLLFRPKSWTKENYVAFCTVPTPVDQAENCFNLGLVSWIGPQAAFALLPRTRDDFDYVFIFQATNRNNAVAFASNLASSLGEPDATDTAPNIRVLSINRGTAEERRMAVTEAFVIIGTPKAVDYTLSHGNASLADQADYQRITAQLPRDDFATIYVRSNSFESDLRPAIKSLFGATPFDAFARLISRVTPLVFPRTSTAAALVGLSLRVDQREVGINIVADFPFSLKKLNALPITAKLLNRVGATPLPFWTALHLNVAGLARELNISDALRSLAAESGNEALAALLDNGVTGQLAINFAQSLQTVLTHADGELLMLALPQGSGSALMLSLIDKQSIKAASVMQTVLSQLRLAALTGAVTLTEKATAYGTVVNIGGASLAALGGSIDYILTPANMLIICSGGYAEQLAAQVATDSGLALQQLGQGWSDAAASDRFLYLYAQPAVPSAPSTMLISGAIRQQTLYLEAKLQPVP